MSISAYDRKLAPPGDEPYCRVKWQGPASYTQVTPGNPATGGDSISGAQFGVNSITGIIFLGTYSGNFQVVPVRTSEGKWALEWRSLVTATVGGQSQTTGVQATGSTNLSTEFVKLQINTLAG